MCFYERAYSIPKISWLPFLLVFHIFGLPATSFAQSATVVTIEGEKFYINGNPTYQGVSWQGYPVEGLLFNARMVQGVFDDLNPQSQSQWK